MRNFDKVGVRDGKYRNLGYYHTSREELYLKAGKGYETTSLSCTNKINRWIYQGFTFHQLLFSTRFNLLGIGIEGTLFNQFMSSIIQTDKDLSSVFLFYVQENLLNMVNHLNEFVLVQCRLRGGKISMNLLLLSLALM